MLKILHKLIYSMSWKGLMLSLFVFLIYMDLLVYGHYLIAITTTVTTITPSAALMLFSTDSDDLERRSDSGTALPTIDNDDNSLGYTGRVSFFSIITYFSYFFVPSISLHINVPSCHCHTTLINIPWDANILLKTCMLFIVNQY